jgi:hypothetical protein
VCPLFRPRSCIESQAGVGGSMKQQRETTPLWVWVAFVLIGVGVGIYVTGYVMVEEMIAYFKK